MYPWDKWDFGPRFGLAYKVAPKTGHSRGLRDLLRRRGEPGRQSQPRRKRAVQRYGHLGRIDLNDNPLPNNFVTNPWFAGGLSAGLAFERLPGACPDPASMASARTPGARWCRSGTWPSSANWLGTRRWRWPTSAITRATNTRRTRRVGIPAPTWEPPTPASLAPRSRPIPYIGVGSVTNSNAYANYNALTVKVEKRLSNGLQFITSYAWSHVMTDACLPLSNVCPIRPIR